MLELLLVSRSLSSVSQRYLNLKEFKSISPKKYQELSGQWVTGK